MLWKVNVRFFERFQHVPVVGVAFRRHPAWTDSAGGFGRCLSFHAVNVYKIIYGCQQTKARCATTAQRAIYIQFEIKSSSAIIPDDDDDVRGGCTHALLSAMG